MPSSWSRDPGFSRQKANQYIFSISDLPLDCSLSNNQLASDNHYDASFERKTWYIPGKIINFISFHKPLFWATLLYTCNGYFYLEMIWVTLKWNLTSSMLRYCRIPRNSLHPGIHSVKVCINIAQQKQLYCLLLRELTSRSLRIGICSLFVTSGSCAARHPMPLSSCFANNQWIRLTTLFFSKLLRDPLAAKSFGS